MGSTFDSPERDVGLPLSAPALALAASALLVGSCARSLDDLEPFACAADASCPKGWTCRAGFCRKAGAPDPGPDAGSSTTPVFRECSVDMDCLDAGAICVPAGDGRSVCLRRCTGEDGQCDPEWDCKLIAGAQGLGVTTCVPTGTSKGACKGATDCVAGWSCSRWPAGAELVCQEQCHPYHSTCDDVAKLCKLGTYPVFPESWGYCVAPSR